MRHQRVSHVRIYMRTIGTVVLKNDFHRLNRLRLLKLYLISVKLVVENWKTPNFKFKSTIKEYVKDR